MNLDFSKIHILVVGDVILDKYYYGSVNRISQEAPVPIVKVIKEKQSPGGSGNVISNINGLGAKSFHISLTGKDVNAQALNTLLSGLNTQNTLIETGKPTVTKIRVIGEHQQVVRLDFEELYEIDAKIHNKIIDAVESVINNVNAVVISDYGKGMCSPDICNHIISRSNSEGIPVIVDPKGYDWNKYRNATIVTPNVKELGLIAGREIPNQDYEIEKYGAEIINKYSLKNLIVTRSDKGMTLINRDTAYHLPTDAVEVYDVSGAGDTVVAAVAVGLAADLAIIDSAKLANRAAGIVVSKSGTVPIELEELIYSFHEGSGAKILQLHLLNRIIDQLNSKGKKIIYTAGEFDSIDIKFIKFLKDLKKKGDIIIVGIENKVTDDKTPEIGEIIANLETVDYVVILNRGNLPDQIKEKVKIIYSN